MKCGLAVHFRTGGGVPLGAELVKRRPTVGRKLPESLLVDTSKECGDIPCVNATSTLTSKNQTTLPKVVVEALGVAPGDKLVYESENGRLILRAKTGRLIDLAGKFAHFGHKPRQTVTLEEMEKTVGDAYAEHGMRGLRRPVRK